MTLVQRLRQAAGYLKEPNLYDDAADRLNELERQDEVHWKTRRSLLRENLIRDERIRELEAAFDALNLLTSESADQLRQERDVAVARIAELEACVLEYWNAKDWDEIGAADCTAAKLVDMKAGAAKIADTSLTPTVHREGEHE